MNQKEELALDNLLMGNMKHVGIQETKWPEKELL